MLNDNGSVYDTRKRQALAPGNDNSADQYSACSAESYEGGQEILEPAEVRNGDTRVESDLVVQEQQQQGDPAHRAWRESNDDAEKDRHGSQQSSYGGDRHHEREATAGKGGDAVAAPRRSQEQRTIDAIEADLVTAHPGSHAEHDDTFDKGACAEDQTLRTRTRMLQASRQDRHAV